MAEPTEESKDAKKGKKRGLDRPGISRTEKIFALFALVILGVLSYSYYFDVPLTELFRIGESEDKLSQAIGKATVVEGQVLRKRAREASFRPLAVQANIFPNDTVMTGPDGLCVIVFKNGRTIRITANSLIKLTWDGDTSKNNIVVDVLRGSYDDDAARAVPLQGKLAPPLGIPGPAGPKEIVPLAVLGLSPRAKGPSNFSDEEFADRKKPVRVWAKMNREGTAKFELFYDDPTTKKKVRVVSTDVAISSDLNAAVTFVFDHPGTYDWNVLNEHHAVIAGQTIELGSRVQALRALPAYDATDKIEGGAVKRDFEGVLLRWAPIEGPGSYHVRVTSGGKTTSHESTASEWRVGAKDFRMNHALTYSIEKEAPGGFLVTSGPQRLVFELAAPELTAPAAEAKLDTDEQETRGDLITFTWQKTNFTTTYEFELATQPGFGKPLVSRSSRDNYYSLRTPAPGRYFWRVRAKVLEIWTPFSEPRGFTVESTN